MDSKLDANYLIAVLQALDQQLDSLTLKKADEEVSTLCRVHGGTFEKVAIALDYYSIKEKRWNNTSAAMKFKKADGEFVQLVAQPLANEVAFSKQTGKNLSSIRLSTSLKETLHRGIKTTIDLLRLV